MVLLEVPFIYTRLGRAARCRTPDSHLLSATTVIRVPEYTAGQAPLAAQCTYGAQQLGPADQQGVHAWVDTQTTLNYRVVDGHLVRPATAYKDNLANGSIRFLVHDEQVLDRATMDRWMARPDVVGVDTAQAYMDTMLNRARMGSRMPYAELPGPNRQHVRDYTRRETADGFVERYGDNRADELARARAMMAQGLCFIDSALHVPSMGPGWSPASNINYHTLGSSHGRALAKAIPEMSWQDGWRQALSYLPADKRTCAAAIGAGFIGFSGEVEVYEAYAPPPDGDEWALRSAGYDLCLDKTAAALFRRNQVGAMGALAAIAPMLDTAQPCAHQLRPLLEQVVEAMQTPWVAVDESMALSINLVRQTLARDVLRRNLPELDDGPAMRP